MPEVDDDKNPSPRSKSSRILWISVVVVPLVVAAIWFWLARPSQPSAEDAPQARVKSTLHLDTFVLNLSDPDERAYLRVGIDLGLDAEPKRGEESAPIAEVRDTILGVLAQGRVDELLTEAGKTKLKQDLLTALRNRMPRLGVEEVYFTEFLIQR